MGIISLEQMDRLFWLGRYAERVYTTIGLFSRSYDSMIDYDTSQYMDFCQKLDIPNIYTSNEQFCDSYCFGSDNINSIYSNLVRAYDNAIVLREEISSATLSYIQLAIYYMERARESKAPLLELQKIIDVIMAFWGMIDDNTDNRNARNIIKTGKHIERMSLYGRLNYPASTLKREAKRLKGRIKQTKLVYNKESLENIAALTLQEPLEYAKIVVEVESLI